MARVVKKQKKQKGSSSDEIKSNNIAKILGAVAGVVVTAALIVGIVFLVASNSVETKYKNSRSIDYDTLVNEVLSDDANPNDFESTMYILVFHSDYEEFEDNVLSASTESAVQKLIKADLKLNEAYNKTDISNSKRIGFYTLDLNDDDNLEILNNETFGNKEGGPFLMKIESQTVSFKTLGTTYINDLVSDFTLEYEKNQDK